MGEWNHWCATALLWETSVCAREHSSYFNLIGRAAVVAVSAFGKETESLSDLPPSAESQVSNMTVMPQ